MSIDTPEVSEFIDVFYSYAQIQRDRALYEKLEKHLSVLNRLGLIRGWHHRDIQIGTEWRQAVDEHLDAAHIILLLISSDFLASDYCYSVEMQRALEKHRQGKARVIPVILRPVDLEGIPILASLRSLPSGGKPITTWPNRDEAFADVSRGIREVIQELKAASPKKKQESSSPAKQLLQYETINTVEIVARFRNLLQPESRISVLRLIGEAKMGKSHLLTKVFPSIAEQEDQIGYAILDMRNHMYAVPDILHMACSQIGSEYFSLFHTAYDKWQNRPKSQRSQTRPTMEQSASEDIQTKDHDLTAEFVRDLSKLNDKLLVFLFDSVNSAKEYMQTWLANIFLPYVSQLAHIRAVVAGRSLPDIHGAYVRSCESYYLHDIKNVEDYINYCQVLDIQLAEQSIRDFAFACDYTPGMFAELVYPKFAKVRKQNV